MNLRVDIDGVEYLLQSCETSGEIEYVLSGAAGPLRGAASVARLGTGAYSVLLEGRSYTVRLFRDTAAISVHVAGQRYRIRLTDARDRRSQQITASNGPVDIRSQMPGKVLKFLVKAGQEVSAGQSLIVVEAMKMQNEITAPKDGIVERIVATEGATVGAGEVLLTVA